MWAIGIDIGGTNIKVGLVDEKGDVTNSYSFKINNNDEYFVTISKLGKSVVDFIKESNINKSDIKGVGVGCPGVINAPKGMVDYSCNLHWDHVPLKELLETEIGLPVRVTNDANAAALGEAKFGAGSLYKNIIMLTLGTGVGGGIIINGEIYEGNEGKGAELGHIVLKKDGRPCGCGRNGCLETYASATGLLLTTKEKMKKHPESILWDYCKGDIENIAGYHPFDGEKAGDKACIDIINEYVSDLSEGIMNYCNIFRPEAIILSGGVAKQGDNLTDKIIAYCERYHYGYKNSPATAILTAKLGYDSGIIGAAALYL